MELVNCANDCLQAVDEYFLPSIEALIKGGVDLLAFDTIPSQQEAIMICKCLQKTALDFPACISFSCKVKPLFDIIPS